MVNWSMRHDAALRRSRPIMVKMPQAIASSVAPAATSEHGGNAFGIDAARRIVAVAKQVDAIGKAADSAITGVNQREPQIAAVEPERRQHPSHVAGGIDDIDRGRMRVLIVLGVVRVVEADCRCCSTDVRCRGRSRKPLRGRSDRRRRCVWFASRALN